jgi:uncharacterized protein (DUF1919 family)
MNNFPFFSIIIPVYNVENYIAACLDSVFAQKIDSYEVICVNDSSPDNSRGIIVEYQKKYPQIVLFDRQNGGLSAARNSGLQIAKGEYVILLDSDDTLVDGCLSIISKRIHEDRCEVLIGNTLSVDLNGEIKQTTQKSSEIINKATNGKTAYNQLNKSDAYVPMAYNLICNREFLIRNNLYFKEGIVFEDELWTPQTLIKAQHVSTLDSFHYNYYRRENTIINSPISLFKIKSLLIVADELIDLERSNKKEFDIDVRGWLWIRSFYLYRDTLCKMRTNNISYPISKIYSVGSLFKAKLPIKYFEKCLSELNLTQIQKRLLKIMYLLYPVNGKKELISKYIYRIQGIFTDKLNKLYCWWLQRRNNNVDFTIISNNCWGGGIYEDLNLEYRSPTVGLFFYAPCYLNFLENFDRLIDSEIKFVLKSKYNIANNYRVSHNHYYPIGILDDVEIHFLHYDTEVVAEDKWIRRKERINRDNLFVKFCNRDLCTSELILRFDNLKFKNKVFFTNKKLSGIKSSVYLPFYKNQECVGDLYSNRWTYRLRFNTLKWLKKD